jgi:para-nitrobenzyl esterase
MSGATMRQQNSRFAGVSPRLRLLSIAVACLAAHASLDAAAKDTAAPMVTLADGALLGVQHGSVSSFKGIPYAAPPTGSRRWMAPATPSPWRGVRNASEFGADCVQKRVIWDPTQSKLPVSEDCLTANVWTPKIGMAARAPVMVWVHGGGYVMGSGSQPIFDGTALARRGIVLVTFNYRLGRFGFFAHPALVSESGGGPVGNYGFMDQIALVAWVHRNIAAFGGDPNNVTIFGESAGGGAVLRLLLAPQARGQFQRAIVSSGGGRDVWPALTAGRGQKPSAESVAMTFATRAGVNGNDVKALRDLPAATVLGDLDLINSEADTFSGPLIDGSLVSEDTSAGFAHGKQATVPLLIGTNSDELGFAPPMMLKVMTDKAAEPFGGSIETLVAAYGSRQAFDARFAGDVAFVEPARFLARAAADAGANVYTYRLGYVTPAKRASQSGAWHASELPYVFDTLSAVSTPIDPADQEMATILGDYWVEFARTGAPAPASRPAWPRYTRASPVQMDLDERGGIANLSSEPPLDAIESLFKR